MSAASRSQCAGAALVLTFAGGCVLPAETGFRTVVDSQILGAEAVEDGDVLEGLAHHPPRGYLLRRAAAFRPDALDDDRDRIRFYYHRRGYFSVEVPQPEVVEADAGTEGVVVTYLVREGPRFLVESITLACESELPQPLDDYRRLLELREGAGFDASRFEGDAQRIESRLRRQAFFDADVAPEAVVDRTKGTVRLRFAIRPGVAKRFGSLRVNAGFVPEDSVRARVAWREGDAYSPARVRTTEGRMYELDSLSSVRFDFDSRPGEPDLEVQIDARESLANELRVGGGVLIDSANILVRGRATYLRRHFLNPLQSLRLTLLPEYFVEPNRPGFQGSADVFRDDVLGWYRTLASYGGRYSIDQYEGFRAQPATGRVALERPFFEDRLSLRVEAGYTYQDVSIQDANLGASPLAEDAGLDSLGYAYIRGSASYDGRDDALSPHRGYFAGLSVDAGRGVRGLRNSFALVRGQLQGYVPLWTERIVAAARLRGATQAGESPLPVAARVFGGGSGHHRGFARRELSPGVSGEDGSYVPVGGEVEMLASVEMRFELVKVFGEWAGIVVFTDAGDVALSAKEMNLAPPHVALGTGLRVGTPVGPLRLDTAIRLNRRGEDEPAPGSSWAFHFAIGEAF